VTQFVNRAFKVSRSSRFWNGAQKIFSRARFPENQFQESPGLEFKLQPGPSAKLRRMNEALAADATNGRRWPPFLTSFRASVPSVRETALASGSALLLVLAFPNFDIWWLAWIGLAPLLFVVMKASRNRTAFLLGLIWGTIFFYGTCWWLTYPMIHYGGVSARLAYPLLLLPVVFVSVFPALACACVSRVVKRFGSAAIFAAPILWVAFDWLRGAVTGLDWNALGYSQAFHPMMIWSRHPAMIQLAKVGGVHTVTFLIVLTSAAFAFVLVRRGHHSLIVSVLVFVVVVVIVVLSNPKSYESSPAIDFAKDMLVVGIQPNVPMFDVGNSGYRQLLERHVELSETALANDSARRFEHRLVIWPESPMNFAYSRDSELQTTITNFARANQTSVLLNSLEPAPNGGSSNSAILVNEQGEKVAQYDKIRLMPFGEYVPLPRWLPGSGSVRSIVGEFTPGSSYTLMPLGALRAGVFICIEAAHPGVARAFTNEGADVLINISNDGYLGPTPVMRQHLANAIFRAVENDRDMLRVTNSGISAYISSNGSVWDTTPGFQEAVRTWTVSRSGGQSTFYSRHGDVFVYGCALISLGVISATFMTRRKRQ
jgi:apolipoprotein N-acyltransferase